MQIKLQTNSNSGKFVLFILLFSVVFLAACQPNKKSENNYFNKNLSTTNRVKLLLSQMTLDEKIGQMCQYVGEPSTNNSANKDEEVPYLIGLGERAYLIKQGKIGSFLKVPTYKEANYLQQLAEQSRLKIPLLIATDALHGNGMYKGPTTVFPTQIGMASTFDTILVHKIAEYTACETRATGCQWVFAPNIEVVRDLRWGRTGETFGEDPYLVSMMGKAMINGFQGNNLSDSNDVLACAKHFVGGGISYNGLNGAPADISERTLNEIFFPPFIEAIRAHVYTMMPAHNEINGIPCHAHQQYLTGLIRETWGFEGFFVSDWMDIERLCNTHKIAETDKEACRLAVLAGVDIHMQGPVFFDKVKELVEEGAIPMTRIDEAVNKILYAKFQLGLFENRYVDSMRVENSLLKKEHRELALASAEKSIVLLKNENHILPVSRQVKSIFITGPNADNQALLGDWCEFQPNENITTVYEGVKEIASPETKIDFLEWNHFDSINHTILTQAQERSASADLSIVVVGEYSIRFDKERTSGENLDRPTLDLAGSQLELLKAVQRSGKPLIVVLINGAPIASPWMVEQADGIIESWEPGMAGGKAIAEVIFGLYNPGGRLPVSIPQSVGQLQSFYNYKPSAFHRGRFYQSSSKPLFEFGYGLSYTQFEYSNLQIPSKIGLNDSLLLRFTLQNTGLLAGDEVVLIFLHDQIGSVVTPVKKLVAFNRYSLQPGEIREVEFIIPNQSFSLLNQQLKPVIEPGKFDIIIGNNNLTAEVLLE